MQLLHGPINEKLVTVIQMESETQCVYHLQKI
jgi:hypothetical protein